MNKPIRLAIVAFLAVVTAVVAQSHWGGVIIPPAGSGSSGGSGDVTAASNFGTDNRIIRSDGTTKGVQSSGVTIDDSANTIVTIVAKTNAAVINAGSGPNQYATLSVNSNLTFVPLAGADGSNASPTRVSFTQDATGTRTLTLNGAALGINTNALSTTDVYVWIQNGATNTAWSVALRNSVAARGDLFIYDGTNWISFGNAASQGQVLMRTNSGVGWAAVALPTGGSSISTNGNQFGAAIPLTLKDGVRLTNMVAVGDSRTVLSYDATATNAVIDCTLGNHFYLNMSTNTLLKFTNGIPGHWVFLELVQTNGGGFNWFFETNAAAGTIPVSSSEQPFLPANTNLGMANLISLKTSASGTKLYMWQSTGFP